jgi:hypothetical protein
MMHGLANFKNYIVLEMDFISVVSRLDWKRILVFWDMMLYQWAIPNIPLKYLVLLTWQSSVTVKICSYGAVRTSKLTGYREISCAFDSVDRAAVMHWNRCTNILQQEYVNILPT